MYKNAISHFMTNQQQLWNAISLCGNPTKSKEVNGLIKAVKKKEICKKGATPHFDRAWSGEKENVNFDTISN